MLGLGNTLSGGIVPAAADAYADAFIFTMNTELAGSATKTFVLPLVDDGSIDFNVDWGDDSTSNITAYDDAAVTHVYDATGTYTVKLAGTIRGWKFNNGGDRRKMLNISQWGDFNFTVERGMRGCTVLTCTATDAPTISTSSMYFGLAQCKAFDGAIGNWDMSGVSNIQYLFYDCEAFNQSIDAWDVSSVTSLYSTFSNMDVFNQPLNSWDISSVTAMGYMFSSASQFNQPLSNWDTSNVIDMSRAFKDADNFDQSLADWDIEGVQQFTNTFMSGVTLSTANYDATLIAWAAQDASNSEVVDFGNSTYTAAPAAGGVARQSLIDDDSWTITDGGAA